MPNGWDEGSVRLAIFIACLLTFSLLELWRPQGERKLSRLKRWPTNLGIIAAGTLLTRFFLPILAVEAAYWAQAMQWGLFNLIDTPFWLAFVASLLLLDLLIYGQHVLTHRIPFLWALHKVHHCDRDIDVTTALRFHPLEIFLSMALKVVVIKALGAPPLAVMVFEIVLNSSALFNHSNLRLPLALDRILRLAIVTPDMHRIHHSTKYDEHNRNFGFSFSFWDRIFGTYREQASHTPDRIRIGLDEYQASGPEKLWWSLSLPFKRYNNADSRPK